MKNKIFIKNTFMMYIMTFGRYVFPLITLPYLTRVLEPEMYGVVTYMTATVTYFQILVDYGFNLSATKEIAENRDDKHYIGKLLGSVIQAKLLLVIFSLIIYTVIIQFIPILRENLILSYLFMGTVILSVWLPDYLFRGIEKMEKITTRFFVSKTISTVLTFILVQSKEDVFWVPLLNIIGSLVAVIWTWHHIKYSLGIYVIFSNFTFAIKKISNSTIYFISTFATTIFGITNTFMIGVMGLPLEQIAYWSVCLNLIGSAQALYTPITNSLYPHMIARKDFKLVKKLLYTFLPLILVATIVVYVFSELIITIISGEKYIDAIPIFRTLLPVLIFSFPAMVFGFPVLGAIGRVKEVTITTVISAVFHIIGIVMLVVIGRFTVMNIAILRSVTEFILMATRGYYLLHLKSHFRNNNQN